MNRVQVYGLQDKIGQILIPTEDVVEMKGGKKVVSSKLFFPGYILVEMELNDDTWHLVRNTPKVSGFVSQGNQPTPLTEEEVNQILHQAVATPLTRTFGLLEDAQGNILISSCYYFISFFINNFPMLINNIIILN